MERSRRGFCRYGRMRGELTDAPADASPALRCDGRRAAGEPKASPRLPHARWPGPPAGRCMPSDDIPTGGTHLTTPETYTPSPHDAQPDHHCQPRVKVD